MIRYRNQLAVDPPRPAGSNPLVMQANPTEIDTALAAWGLPVQAPAPLGSGLINLTWQVALGDGSSAVLQRVNPVFPPAVNRDIDTVTRRLQERGMTTPRLIPTLAGGLWFDGRDGTWRLMSHIAGVTRDHLGHPGEAAAAGRLLAQFHQALGGLDCTFANPRLGVHDTSRHLARLRSALVECRDHPRFAEVQPLAATILGAADALPPLPLTADRIVHGDPKINNMLFDPQTGKGIALVDLDTVGRMPLPLELGDAFRSWCNPAGENERSGEFSPELFAAALESYAAVASDDMSGGEQLAILPATETIVVELAARFCADALYENYFGWDSRRFASRGEHNQVRASGQLALARSMIAQRPRLERVVRQVFSH